MSFVRVAVSISLQYVTIENKVITSLLQVLTEILSTKRGRSENDIENQNISSQQGGIEIQVSSSTADQNKSSDESRGNEKQTNTAKLMLEAFLSLALVIRDKMLSADA